MEYVRIQTSDVWHWQEACTHLRQIKKRPHRPIKLSTDGRPKTGELCNECLAKEKSAGG